MALLRINEKTLSELAGRTAGARIAAKMAQSVNSGFVTDVQRVLDNGRYVGQLLGLSQPINEVPLPQMGGLTLKQAKAIHEQMMAARVALKSLFFIRFKDLSKPIGNYTQLNVSNSGSGNILKDGISRIGAAAGSVMNGISGAVNDIAGAQASVVANGLMGGFASGIGFGMDTPTGGDSIAQAANNTFDLLAMDVSYGASIVGDVQNLGSGFWDKPTGVGQTEVSITTMDDEAGTIKRWFEGKMQQVARTDGTVGLPSEYLLNMEVVHAVASPAVETAIRAYSKQMWLRPSAIDIELSRRDQGVAELRMTFSQFDSFNGKR